MTKCNCLDYDDEAPGVLVIKEEESGPGEVGEERDSSLQTCEYSRCDLPQHFEGIHRIKDFISRPFTFELLEGR